MAEIIINQVPSSRPGVAWLRAITTIDKDGKASTEILDVPVKGVKV